MFNYYNNETIRKLVIAVGTVFNNVHVMHRNKDGNEVDFKVPLTYAPKEKYIKRLTNPSSISNRTRVEISVPQMAFELTDILHDHSRHLNKLNNRSQQIGDQIVSSYSEVPYNFGFGLYVYTRNIEENLQIMEQILPYFSPEFVVSLNLTSIHKKIDVPIVLLKTLLSQEYEGDFSARRVVISTYQFVAKSYIYGEVKAQTPVSQFTLNLEDFDGTQY
jgi:hypothetical protein